MNNPSKFFIKSLLTVASFLIFNQSFATKNGSNQSDCNQQVKADAQKAGHDIKKTADQIKKNVVIAAQNVKEDVKHSGHTIKEDIKVLAHDVKEGIQDTACHAKEKVKQKFANIKENIEEKAQDIKDTMTNLKEEAQEKVHIAKENVKVGTALTKEAIKEKAHDVTDKTKEASSNIQKSAQEKAASAQKNMNLSMKTAQKKVHDLKEGAKNVFSQKENDHEHMNIVLVDSKQPDAGELAELEEHIAPIKQCKKEFKKKIKNILKEAKTQRNALLKKLAKDLHSYQILLEELVKKGLPKCAIDDDPNIVILKNAIETTRYEIAFLQAKYNKIWAKAYPTLGKLMYESPRLKCNI